MADDMGLAQADGAPWPRLRLLNTPGAGRRSIASGGSAPEAVLRVGVLGPLSVDGAAGELQPRQAELVASLALAGAAGLSAEVLRTRLGSDPDHPMDADVFRQAVTRTRRRLGTTPGGGECIVYDACGGRYRLDATVRVDLDEFRALALAGRASRDPRPLSRALSLLRGHPLDGAYWWWLDMATIEGIRAEAVDTAVLLSQLALEAGDPVTGRRAALAGLAVDPAAEELWRQVMLAEDLAGSAAGVHRAWVMCRTAIADIAPDGHPHPATTALYHDLASPRARTLAAPDGAAGEALRAQLLAERRAAARAAG